MRPLHVVAVRKFGTASWSGKKKKKIHAAAATQKIHISVYSIYAVTENSYFCVLDLCRHRKFIFLCTRFMPSQKIHISVYSIYAVTAAATAELLAAKLCVQRQMYFLCPPSPSFFFFFFINLFCSVILCVSLCYCDVCQNAPVEFLGRDNKVILSLEYGIIP